jgi:hypothetical protein
MPKYLVLAKPYYEWAGKNLSSFDAETSAFADARWMAEFFEVVSKSKGVARIRSASGVTKRVPESCLVEFPE